MRSGAPGVWCRSIDTGRLPARGSGSEPHAGCALCAARAAAGVGSVLPLPPAACVSLPASCLQPSPSSTATLLLGAVAMAEAIASARAPLTPCRGRPACRFRSAAALARVGLASILHPAFSLVAPSGARARATTARRPASRPLAIVPHIGHTSPLLRPAGQSYPPVTSAMQMRPPGRRLVVLDPSV